MAEIVDGGDWTLDILCTGEGNGGGGCRKLVRIGFTDLFNSNTITRPFVTFACPACDAWTDLPGAVWPVSHEEAKWLPERRRAG